MSETAKVYFKKSSVRKGTLMQAEENVFLSGIPRNRVTGAGKHLRWITPQIELKAAISRFEIACQGIGLPHNVGWGNEKPSLHEIKRATGWIDACASWKPAMVVLRSLYDLKSDKGAGSPVHTGGANISWLFGIWESPRFITHVQARGFAWLVKACKHVKDGEHVVPCIIGKIAGRKLLEYVGKLTPLSRWAICSRLPRWSILSHRDLDWGYLASLKKSQKLALIPEELRSALLWNEVGVNCPRDTTVVPSDISLAAFKKVFDFVEADYKRNPEVFDAILRLVFMFGKDAKGIIKYVEAYRDWTNLAWPSVDKNPEELLLSRLTSVHDCAQKLPLSKSSAGWRAFVVKNFAVKSYADIMDNMAQVEQICGGAPNSVSEARLKFQEKRIAWVFDLNDTEKRFIKDTPAKDFEMCPYVNVEHKGYTLTKLAYNDPLQISIGRLVDCCQHLNGAGADCVSNAWTSGYCAIYAVVKDDKPVSQAFAWRSKDDNLVFDSLEALGGVDRKTVCELFLMAAKKLVGKLGIRKVLVGKTHYGITSDFIESCTWKEKIATPAKEFSLRYSDANQGCYVVTNVDFKLPKRVAKTEYVDNAEREDLIVNELSEDSDVYCEHCNAQVHPTCEVCPTCHEEIAEWV